MNFAKLFNLPNIHRVVAAAALVRLFFVGSDNFIEAESLLQAFKRC